MEEEKLAIRKNIRILALDKLKYMELTDEKLKQVKDEADFKIMLDEALKA